jgi:carbon storage regulator CsrA
MLVLTRRPHEAIYVDTPAGRIEVILVKTGENRSRIGVKAPPEWPVNRAEIVAGPYRDNAKSKEPKAEVGA